MAGRLGRLGLLAPLILAPIEGLNAPVAAKTWASGTFIYADLCTEGSGRVGRSITLRRSPNGNALTYKSAVAEPVRIDAITVEDETRSVSFVLETDRGTVRFRGRIEGGALTGTVEDAEGAHDVRLPRVLRAPAQPCRNEKAGSIVARR